MAEQGCLLSSCAGYRAEGSNPSLSAAPPARCRLLAAATLSAFLAALPTPGTAQPTGGMDGVVLDATGGVLSGARVSLVLQGRGVRREQAAGPSGRFGFA